MRFNSVRGSLRLLETLITGSVLLLLLHVLLALCWFVSSNMFIIGTSRSPAPVRLVPVSRTKWLWSLLVYVPPSNCQAPAL
jgi:hypothetical protein